MNKKRVGVLTFFKSNNYGTALQAYATQKLLQEKLKDICKVEIVDVQFCNEYVSNTPMIQRLIKLLNPLFLSCFIKRMIAHKRIINFCDNNFMKTETYRFDNYEKCLNALAAENFEVLISGSDEIWANKQGVPIPNVYFIPKEIEATKISFATSANRGDFDALTLFEKDMIKKSLSDYRYISVRDTTTMNFIGQLTNRNIELTFDPALSYSFPAVEYDNKHLKRARHKGKKVICFMLKDINIMKKIKNEYKVDGAEFVSILPNVAKINTLEVRDPFEFAASFKHFDLFVTDFFHGTVFCIKNDVPFISIDHEEISKRYESKISDMLKRLNLLEHYLQFYKRSEEEFFELYKEMDFLLGKNFIADYSNQRKLAQDKCEAVLCEIRSLILNST